LRFDRDETTTVDFVQQSIDQNDMGHGFVIRSQGDRFRHRAQVGMRDQLRFKLWVSDFQIGHLV
jgi:hypothetical protein